MIHYYYTLEECLMPKVTFHPSMKTIDVSEGTTLFDAAKRVGLPVASSCGADNVCGRCNMQVLDGVQHLSGQENPELVLLRRDKKDLTDRISCMTRVLGDCTVTTTYW